MSVAGRRYHHPKRRAVPRPEDRLKVLPPVYVKMTEAQETDASRLLAEILASHFRRKAGKGVEEKKCD